MKADLSERLRLCIEVEETACEIYTILQDMFPQDRGFFHDMALEEENHASVLTVATGFNRVGKLPDRIVPRSMSPIYKSHDVAIDIRQKITKNDMSIKEALELALQMEESMVESYFYEVMHSKTEDKVMSVLQEMATYSESHTEKIKNFMEEKGLLDTD